MTVNSNVIATIMCNAIILMANVHLVGVQLVTGEMTVKKVKSFCFYFNIEHFFLFHLINVIFWQVNSSDFIVFF